MLSLHVEAEQPKLSVDSPCLIYSQRRSRRRQPPPSLRSGIFASIGNAPLVENPYPHLVVEEALPRAIADVLLAEMPPLDVVLQGQEPGSNVRFTLPSPLALSNPRISDTWKDAIRACLDASQDYLDLTLKRFGAHLIELFPDFETRFGPIDELRAVPRYGPRAHNEVGMDAQIVVNSPPLTDGTSVRGPHLAHTEQADLGSALSPPRA